MGARRTFAHFPLRYKRRLIRLFQRSWHFIFHSSFNRTRYRYSTNNVIMNEASKTLARLCCMCHRKATCMCTTCKCSFYCSTECLQDDKPVHKLLCRAHRNHKTQIPPEPALFKAIFFKAKKTAPEWVWVRMTSQPGDEGFALQYYMMLDDQAKGLVSCGDSIYNCVLKRSHDAIHMLGCLETCPTLPDQLCLDGAPDLSMGNIAHELLECCKGNILFVGHRAHLDVTSFRHIVDMMYMEYDKSLRQLGDQKRGHIPGVRINCIGDRLVSDRPTLEACKVTDSFYEKDENLLMWIASKLGIDLFARTILPALPWRNRSGGHNCLHYA